MWCIISTHAANHTCAALSSEHTLLCWLQGELLQQMAINRARLGQVLQVRV